MPAPLPQFTSVLTQINALKAKNLALLAALAAARNQYAALGGAPVNAPREAQEADAADAASVTQLHETVEAAVVAAQSAAATLQPETTVRTEQQAHIAGLQAELAAAQAQLNQAQTPVAAAPPNGTNGTDGTNVVATGFPPPRVA